MIPPAPYPAGSAFNTHVDGLRPNFEAVGRDPRIAPGLARPITSIVCFISGATKTYLVKTGAADTAWTPPGGAAGSVDFMAVTTIAALSALDTTALDDQSVAFVCTVADQWVLHKASAVAADGITVVAANPAGRWVRQCYPSQEWARAYAGTTQQISSAGNDENTGLVGSPLLTAAEMERRLHGLNVAGAQTVNITVGNLGATDPFRKTWTNQTGAETGAFTLNGVRTLSATGASGAVATTAHGTYDVTAALGAGSVNRLVEFLVGAGPAVRCTGWVAADLGAGVFRITQAVNGAGVETAPVIGDTFNVYTLTEVPDIIDENDDSTQAGNAAINIRVNNPAGGNFAQLTGFRFETCDINARAYFSRGLALWTLNNCRVVPVDTTLTGTIAMFVGLVAVGPGGETIMYLPGNGDAAVAFAPSVTFQGTRLRTENVRFIGNTRVSFFDNAAGNACLETSGSSGVIDLLRGTGNIIPGWLLTDPANDFTVSNAPTLVTTNNELAIGSTFGVFADLALTTIRDPHGHVIHGAGVAFVADPSIVAYVTNDNGTTSAPGDVVRMTGTGVNTAFALADSEANQVAAGVLLNTVADNITGIIATAGPAWVRISGTLPTVGAIVWLSGATAGQGTATRPANGIITELGRVLRTSGTRALLALDIRVIPTQLRTPYNFDEFLGGSHTSGQIGKMGWSFTNGSWVRVGASAGHPSVMRRASSAAGAVSDWRLSAFANAQTIRHDQWDFQTFTLSPVQDNTDYDIRTGYMTDTADTTPTDGIYFESLQGEANWFSVTRAAGVQTRKDTGIAYTAAVWYTLMFRKNGTGIDFFINGALVTNHTAAENIPAATAGLVQGGHVMPPALAARDIDFDFWDEQLLPQAR